MSDKMDPSDEAAERAENERQRYNAAVEAALAASCDVITAELVKLLGPAMGLVVFAHDGETVFTSTNMPQGEMRAIVEGMLTQWKAKG